MNNLQSYHFFKVFNKYIKKSNVKYFEAIFEVQGYERVVINTKLLHFNIL